MNLIKSKLALTFVFVIALFSLSSCGKSYAPNYVIPVDEDNMVSSTYTNTLNLAEIDGYDGSKLQAEENVCQAFHELTDALSKRNIIIGAESAFRTFEEQERLHNEAVAAGDNSVPPPGASEHNTGFAIDFAVKDGSKWITGKDAFVKFPDVFSTVKKEISEYGFINSIEAKPWHLRYVGKSVSKEITGRGINFSTYLESISEEEKEKDKGLRYAFSVDELLDSIAPETRIVLNSNFYDLSGASNYGMPDVSPYYSWEKSGNGYELLIHDIDRLVIESRNANASRCKIQSAEGCNHVLVLRNCIGCEIEGVTLSHADKTEFSSILYIDSCESTDIQKCKMIGGSGIGAELNGCNSVNVDYCLFDSCSQYGISFHNSENCGIMPCEFTNCSTPPVFISEECKNIKVDQRFLNP